MWCIENITRIIFLIGSVAGKKVHNNFYFVEYEQREKFLFLFYRVIVIEVSSKHSRNKKKSWIASNISNCEQYIWTLGLISICCGKNRKRTTDVFNYGVATPTTAEAHAKSNCGYLLLIFIICYLMLTSRMKGSVKGI